MNRIIRKNDLNRILPSGLGMSLALALESYADPQLVGHSHSAGIVVELYIATKLHNLPHDVLLKTLYEIKENYPALKIRCDAYDDVLKILHKRYPSSVQLRLLTRKGTLSEAEAVPDDLIKEGIDFYRESYGE